MVFTRGSSTGERCLLVLMAWVVVVEGPWLVYELKARFVLHYTVLLQLNCCCFYRVKVQYFEIFYMQFFFEIIIIMVKDYNHEN